jgi:hypothetical protein
MGTHLVSGFPHESSSGQWADEATAAAAAADEDEDDDGMPRRRCRTSPPVG